MSRVKLPARPADKKFSDGSNKGMGLPELTRIRIMVNQVSPLTPQNVQSPLFQSKSGQSAGSLLVGDSDSVEFGTQGALSLPEAMKIVGERALEKLRSVVSDARAELGIPEGTVLDTSPEATAGRIVDFALGAFAAYAERHSELGDAEARQAFVDIIGPAISQGIEEARGILGALNALTPEVDANITKTAEIIHQRLSDFLAFQ